MLDYSVNYIDSIPYIMPVRQALANGNHSIQTNATGVIIWNALIACLGNHYDKPIPNDTACLSLINSKSFLLEITSIVADSFDITAAEDIEAVANDCREFLNMLISNNVFLTRRRNSYLNADTYNCRISIADINISYEGPKAMLSSSFDDFICIDTASETDTAPITDITLKVTGVISSDNCSGTVVMDANDICVIDCSSYYNIIFKNYSVIRYCHISKDGSICTLFYNIGFEPGKSCINSLLHSIDYEKGAEEVFHCTRFAFLMYSRCKHIYALHSASILYKDRVWLFSGSSGTGKSTHTSLWHSLFGTPIINGDLNLIKLHINQAGAITRISVPGSPWCGTSGIYTTESYPLGGIIFLSKSSKNQIITDELTTDSYIVDLVNRFISPAWEEDALCDNLEAASNIFKHSYVFRAAVNLEQDSAFAVKSHIDSYTNSKQL